MAEEKVEQQNAEQQQQAEKKSPQEASSPTKNKQDNDAAVEKKCEENGDERPKENGQQEKEEVKEMRSVYLSSFGGMNRVKPLKKPEPQGPQQGEVLIKVKACGVNFQDLMARQGALDSSPKPPCIMGFECAGDIEQVGEGVETFKVGDRVVALPDSKAWAELCVVPATSVFAIPAEMSYHDAVAVTMSYTVAYILLFELANISPGKSLLFHSAGGAVGHAIAQLAKTVKDTKLFGVCSKSKHEALKEAGVPIDHLLERGTDYSTIVRKEEPNGIDIVLDCMYGEDCRRGCGLLKPLGRYILYGLSNSSENKSVSAAKFWWQVNKVPPQKLYEENRSMCGFNLRHLLYQKGQHEFVRSAVNKVFKLWKEGKVKPVIDSTFALEDVHDAMQKMHEHKNIGKIILDLSMEPKPKPVTPAKTKSKDKKNQSMSEEKKASSIDSENGAGDKKKEGEGMTNGTNEEKSDTDSKEKESS